MHPAAALLDMIEFCDFVAFESPAIPYAMHLTQNPFNVDTYREATLPLWTVFASAGALGQTLTRSPLGELLPTLSSMMFTSSYARYPVKHRRAIRRAPAMPFLLFDKHSRDDQLDFVLSTYKQ